MRLLMRPSCQCFVLNAATINRYQMLSSVRDRANTQRNGSNLAVKRSWQNSRGLFYDSAVQPDAGNFRAPRFIQQPKYTFPERRSISRNFTQSIGNPFVRRMKRDSEHMHAARVVFNHANTNALTILPMMPTGICMKSTPITMRWMPISKLRPDRTAMLILFPWRSFIRRNGTDGFSCFILYGSACTASHHA